MLELGEAWTTYIEQDLADANENDRKNLGGQQSRNNDEEEESTSYEVNMDRLIQRFSNFNSNSQSFQDEEEEEPEEVHPDDFERADEDYTEENAADKEPEEPEFYDNNYWLQPNPCTEDFNAMLAELEA